jgi:hypothetical protein
VPFAVYCTGVWRSCAGALQRGEHTTQLLRRMGPMALVLWLVVQHDDAGDSTVL